MQLEIPYPYKELSPNARVHHMVLHRKKKSYKNLVYWLVKDSKLQADVNMKIVWHPRTKSADLDNFIASFKAGQDGISQAWGLDDVHFNFNYEKGKSVRGGKVILHVNE